MTLHKENQKRQVHTKSDLKEPAPAPAVTNTQSSIPSILNPEFQLPQDINKKGNNDISQSSRLQIQIPKRLLELLLSQEALLTPSAEEELPYNLLELPNKSNKPTVEAIFLEYYDYKLHQPTSNQLTAGGHINYTINNTIKYNYKERVKVQTCLISCIINE